MNFQGMAPSEMRNETIAMYQTEHIIEPYQTTTDAKDIICNNKGETRKIFLATDLYNLGGNLENIIELIDVDPDQEVINSPSHDSLNYENENDINTQNFNFSFGYEENYGKINNELRCLQLICNTTPSSSSSDYSSLPEYVDINRFLPHVRESSIFCLDKPKNFNGLNDISNIVKDEINLAESRDVSSNSSARESENVEEIKNVAPSPVVRRRGRRKIFGDKRKNPVRRAQINKASLDLVEKLAIPACVFNARLKSRKPKQAKVESKNLRQSCRTSGAIFCPPSPLSNADFKEWPVDGMHEKPSYDVETGRIIKFNLLKIPTNTSPALNLTKPEELKKNREVKLVQQANPIGVDGFQEFAKSAYSRVQMIFNYTKELKEFNELAGKGQNREDDEQFSNGKPTLYERNLQFRLYHNSIKQEDSSGPEVAFVNSKSVVDILQDACTLCSLAGGVDDDFIKMMKSFDAEEESLKNYT